MSDEQPTPEEQERARRFVSEDDEGVTITPAPEPLVPPLVPDGATT